jgi:hypothetical protein
MVVDERVFIDGTKDISSRDVVANLHVTSPTRFSESVQVRFANARSIGAVKAGKLD